MRRFVSPYILGARPSDDHPTVNDWLLIDGETEHPIRVLDRMNLFAHRSPGNPRKRQMIAAKIDTLFIVASCNQDFSVARLERYLVLAREVGVAPVVVLTKTDLTYTPETFEAATRAIERGLRVETVNGRDPASVAHLAAWCGTGQTVALLGSSGVGKSTLVNTLRTRGAQVDRKSNRGATGSRWWTATTPVSPPLLSLTEKPRHPHNAARGSFTELGGIV